MQAFVDASRAWTKGVRRCVETRDTAGLAELLSGYEALETRARMTAARLKGARLTDDQRDALLRELGELGRAAHVAAALAQSEALYYRFCRETAVPAREYTASGEAATEPRAGSHWEA